MDVTTPIWSDTISAVVSSGGTQATASSLMPHMSVEPPAALPKIPPQSGLMAEHITAGRELRRVPSWPVALTRNSSKAAGQRRMTTS
jgi:hypothetical protein